MKKFLSLIILILTSAMCVACGNGVSISYTKDKVYLNMGYTYIVSTGDVTIKNSSSEYEIVSMDESVATVGGNIIYPVAVGKTNIRIRLVENTAIYTDFELVVTNIVYAENAKVSNDRVYININKENESFNPIIYSNSTANEVPEVSYNSKIIDYDYVTGKITPKALGETVVVVLFRDCNVSFRVNVINEIYTISMEIPDCNVVEGYSGKFAFSIFPDNANTYYFENVNNDYISIDSDGSYVAKKSGTITARCAYYSQLNGTLKYVDFQVNILEGISGLDVSVVSPSTEQKNTYYLKENMYRLRIKNTGISLDNFEIYGINIVGEISSDTQGIYVDFYFKNKGDNAIQIDVIFDGYNTAISSTENYLVHEISDIQIKAKCGSYPQDIASDGKYHMNLNGTGTLVSASLKFGAYLVENTKNISVNGIEIYNKETGEKLASNTFSPSSTGEFTFVFKLNGVSFGESIVVVE